MQSRKGVTIQEIEQIFVILDRLGISREAVIIPLRPADPGSVRRLPSGKFEIIVDAAIPLEQWLAGLDPRVRSALQG
jgi:hypothetical protein